MDPDRIKKIRLSLGWSQERLARELGVSFSTVNRWERGRTSPSPLAAKSLEKLDVFNNSQTEGERHALRLKAHCPVEVRLLGQESTVSSLRDTAAFEAVTENLSSTGLMFRTMENVSTGERIGIGWNLGDKHVVTLSEVVWIKDSGNQKNVGVRFDYPIPEVVSDVIENILKP